VHLDLALLDTNLELPSTEAKVLGLTVVLAVIRMVARRLMDTLAKVIAELRVSISTIVELCYANQLPVRNRFWGIKERTYDKPSDQS